jgi:hypothetical protein
VLRTLEEEEEVASKAFSDSLLESWNRLRIRNHKSPFPNKKSEATPIARIRL